MLYKFDQVKDDYTHEWAHMVINSDRLPVAQAQAHKVIANKSRYEALEQQTGVPWYFIGLLHLRESDCDFDTHLHNGDPLNEFDGEKLHYVRTTHVPSNRPRANPINGITYTFEESALDALKEVSANKDWSIERIAYYFESYNGFGYRQHHVNSAYLWASSNQYTGGKYVKDGVFSPTVYDTQLGAMVVLKCILDQTQPIVPVEDPTPLVVTEAKPNTPTAAVNKPTTSEMRKTSRKFLLTNWIKWLTGLGAGTGSVAKALDASNILATKTYMDTLKSFGADYGIFIAIGACIIVAIAAVALEQWMKQDVTDMRYIPSGDSK